MKKINKPFDFNQGIDAKFFSSEKARLISTLRISPLRFAFDSIKDDAHIERAIEKAKKNGMKDIRVYVLYNFKDSPEDFYYRINKLNKLGALSYPMRYRDIDSVENHFISEKWDRKMLRALKLILVFYYTKGMIRKSRLGFKKIFGASKKDFKDKLYEIYENDRGMDKKRHELNFEFKDIKWKNAILSSQ